MKRLVVILGGKGGTGKTTFCRLLLDRLCSDKVNYLAFDADTENPELYEYCKNLGTGVELLEFLEVSEAKRLFTQLRENSPDVAVLDMPGASGRKTREIISKFGLFKIATDLGYRVTLCTVLNLGYEVIASLNVMREFCGDQVDYVIVKNLTWEKGKGFVRWEKSKTRNSISDLKGTEIEMPELDTSAFDEVREHGLPFSMATEENKFPYGDYLLVSSFLARSYIELRKAAPYLGLPASDDSSQSQQKSKPEKKAA
ncbi:MAG: hypothetical protein AAFW75_28425 [Cyanobacteria bacterium J06636_16]